MRHQQQAGKAGGHQQRARRIAKGGTARRPRLRKFPVAVLFGGFKLIIVGRVLPVDGSAASVQDQLRDRFLAGQVGKLIEIFLHLLARARQDVERGRGGCRGCRGGAVRSSAGVTGV